MPKKPVVASYISDFLKRDMLHVYRQVTGFQEVDGHIFTHRRENEELFRYDPKRVHVLPKPRTRWLRRLLHRQIRHEPWQIYRSELRRWILDLTRIDAQVLHIYFGHVAPQFLPLMKAWPHPVVVSFHGADAGGDTLLPRFKATMQEVFHLATSVLCRSQGLAADVVALGCPPEKVGVQRTGIPLEQWPYRPRPAPEDGTWRLLQSCRFIAKKGLDTTLDAFAQVVRCHPRATLALVGDGPLRAELEQKVKSLGLAGHVSFPGFLKPKELREQVYAAHVFLHPSRTTADGDREGIPNAMLEAMASGLPVVATQHGGIPEAVTDQESGLLVPENDSAAMGDALSRLLIHDRLRESLAQGARRSVEVGFDRVIQVGRLEAHYKGLMNRSRSAQ